MFFNHIIIVLFFILNLFKNSFLKTLFIFEHSRHGHRTNSDLDNNNLDIFKEKWDGDSELTNIGLKQHYLLGNYIRNKYNNLINYTSYNPNEIFILSTTSNRTILSARAQLNGIFKLTEKKMFYNKIQKEKKNIPYYLKDQINFENELKDIILPEEIPIHLINQNDYLIRLEKNNKCNKIKNLQKNNINKNIIQDYIKKFNQTFGKQLLDYFNIINESNYFFDYKNIAKFSTQFIINYLENRNITPKLIKYKIDINNLLNFSKIFLNLKSTEYKVNDINNEIGLVSSSLLMRYILNFMENIIKNIENSPKLVILTGHDSTVAQNLDLLRILFNSKLYYINFSSALIFELEQNDENNEYYVNINFNNEKLLKIKYENFKEIIINKTWNFKKIGLYCGFIKDYKKQNKFLIFFIGILNIFITIIITFNIREKRKKYSILNKFDNKYINLIEDNNI